MKKRCLVGRRGYFFLIDSIIALGVLAVGTFLIFTLYANVPSKEEPTILSDDIMDFFANNKIKDVDNAYAGLGGTLWETEGQAGGLCPGEELTANAENTLLQQVAEFYEKSQGAGGNSCYFNLDNNNPNEPEDLAEKFIADLTKNTLPQQYTFEFWMDDQLLYPDTEQTDSKNAAKALIPSKKIVYGILNKETGDMFGPFNAEVFVWQ
jgi:hypothetical protein|tara:strand:- start:725 stop:1348 length:624 start_codon:yes stop_codon:yes gene_type:complete